MSQMEGDRLLPPPPPSSMHRCKVCKKCFPCGRSLGGHMRSHVNMVIAADGDERPQSSYGLRENPKKTWRLSNSGCGDGDKCCRECGKEFLSWRALFGHMKCHSGRPHHASEEKEKIEKQPNCEVTPITVPRRRRRTKRMPVVASCSLSGSEYEHEDEDGAISLMMLSRDVGCWGGGGSSESSVKNSVVLEDGDFVLRGSELDEVRNGFKKMESDASDDHFISDDLDEFEKPKTYSSCADEFAESGEELRKGCPKKNDLNSLAGTEMGSDLEVVKHCSSSKMESLEADSAKLAADHVNGFHCDTPSPHGGEKRSRFECTACKKTFQSYQALGGHRASHKRMKNSPGSRSDANNGSMGNNASVDQIATDELADRGEVSEASLGSSSKKNKEHECLICGKVFSSGQALGGHKRCHQFADGGGSAAYHVVIHQQPLEIANVLDLNLPATVDRDSNSTNAGNAELKSWWVGGSLKHEALVGVISN